MSPVWSARPDSRYIYAAEDMLPTLPWPLGEIRATFLSDISVGIFTREILQLGMT
jgi:hypothetical protein